MSKLRWAALLAAVLIWTGCGRQERREAVTLYKTLVAKQADSAATNALEKDLMDSTKAWCEGLVAGGSGHGAGLAENAASAKALADSAQLVSTKLGQLRQAIYELPLKEEYPQAVRGNLLGDLMKRQKTLQDVRAALQASAANFIEFSQSRSYTGDSYPAGIDRLSTMLAHYKGPEDSLAKALEDLKTKFKIEDADLAG